MPLYSWNQHKPQLSKKVWIAPDAQIIGQVSIGEHSSIWFGCIVRGDVEAISIGKNTNIQDFSLLHVTKGKFSLQIGDNCTLGHRVTAHGCVLKNYSFVGIGATILDGCELGEFSLLAAGSLLAPGKKIPPRMLAMGVPAKIVREISPEEEKLIITTSEHYRHLKDNYHQQPQFISEEE